MSSANHESNEEASKPLLQSNQLPVQTPFLRMLLFGSIVAAPYILAGMNLVFSAVALPQMNVNLNEASWFGSLNFFGSVFGSVSIGLIIDKYGRRPSLIISIITAVIGWTLIAVDFNLAITFLGQFLAGIISGPIFIGVVYAAESIVVNHHHLRNSFSTWTVIAMSVGILLTYTLARLMPYQQVAGFGAAVSFVLLVGVCVLIPESPRWLFNRGQIRRAKDSEKRLSIHQPMLKDVEHDVVVELEPMWESVRSGWNKLKRKDVYKPLIVTCLWSIFAVLSGACCISSYLVNALEDYPVTKTRTFTDIVSEDSNEPNGYDLSIVSALLNLLASILTSVLVSHLGTKKMFYVASSGLALGMVGLGISLSLIKEYQQTEFWHTTHTLSIWAILFFYTLGVATLPTTVSGEIFPVDAKGFAGIPSIFFSLTAAGLVKLHLYFYSSIGPLVYFIYATINVWNMIFVMVCLPETVGRTQEEIGKHFFKYTENQN